MHSWEALEGRVSAALSAELCSAHTCLGMRINENSKASSPKRTMTFARAIKDDAFELQYSIQFSVTQRHDLLRSTYRRQR